MTGINWFFNPYHQNSPRPSRLARRRLHHSHDARKSNCEHLVDPNPSSPPPILEKLGRISRIPFKFCTFRPRIDKSKQSDDHTPSNKPKSRRGKVKAIRKDKHAAQGSENQVSASQPPATPAAAGPSQVSWDTSQNNSDNGSSTSLPRKPRSLYPASIIGLTMVARGEIGYLIASLAETDGIFSSADQS